MYTVQMWLWRCGMHVSLNWLKSIGNRKRCRVLHCRSFWYSRDVSVLAPHVMASHEHTYIWSPTAVRSEQIRAKALWLSISFSETQPRLQLSGFLFPVLRNIVPIFLIWTFGPSLWGWFYSQTAGYLDQIHKWMQTVLTKEANVLCCEQGKKKKVLFFCS